MSINIKKGDRRPRLRATLERTDGTAIDLSASTVTFRMKPRTGGALKISGASVDVIDATAGVVEYAWAEGDTDTTGYFDGEFVITTSGQTETVPSSGYVLVCIEPTLT